MTTCLCLLTIFSGNRPSAVVLGCYCYSTRVGAARPFSSSWFASWHTPEGHPRYTLIPAISIFKKKFFCSIHVHVHIIAPCYVWGRKFNSHKVQTTLAQVATPTSWQGRALPGLSLCGGGFKRRAQWISWPIIGQKPWLPKKNFLQYII